MRLAMLRAYASSNAEKDARAMPYGRTDGLTKMPITLIYLLHLPYRVRAYKKIHRNGDKNMTITATDRDHRAAWERRALRAEQSLARVLELADTLDGGVVDDRGRKVGLCGPIAAQIIRNAAAGKVIA